MTSFLYAKGIRIFDYPRFAEPLRDKIRAEAHAAAVLGVSPTYALPWAKRIQYPSAASVVRSISLHDFQHGVLADVELTSNLSIRLPCDNRRFKPAIHQTLESVRTFRSRFGDQNPV